MNTHYRIILLISLFLLGLFPSQAKTYYISSTDGSDSNSGNSPSLSWKTINKINTFSFVAGDSVLFKRNEMWRGQLLPKSGNASKIIYYGAYSQGKLPTILGSLSFNNSDDWTNVSGNTWKCNRTFSTDIGNIIFDNEKSVGYKKWNLDDLEKQDDFWYDLSTGELLIYSISNPANFHSQIELALRKHIINYDNTRFVTFENLAIKYGAAHGFGGANTANISIKSCEISYIGGGDLLMDGTTRYGNGVEFWGNASNHLIEKCKIWEIYDTGLTNQNHTNTAVQENIRYQNNLIFNCALSSFEYWNRPQSSKTSNIFFLNNTCLYAGQGWGSQRPDYHGIHAIVDSNTAQTDTISIKNNIFFDAKRSTYAIEENANGFFDLDYNLIYQPISDTLFISFPNYVIYTYSNFANFSAATNKELNAVKGNPNFENLSELNFALVSNSTAIDAGTLVDVLDDFNSNPRPINDLFDMGAFEYSEPSDPDPPLGINENQNEASQLISIYPNPTYDSFRVLSENKSFQNYTLNLYNSNGQKVNTIQHYTLGEVVETKKLASGIYLIILIGHTGIIRKGKIQLLK